MLTDLEKIRDEYLYEDYQPYHNGKRGVWLDESQHSGSYLSGLHDGKHFRMLIHVLTVNEEIKCQEDFMTATISDYDDINEYVIHKRFVLYIAKRMDYGSCLYYLGCMLTCDGEEEIALALLARMTYLIKVKKVRFMGMTNLE
jgi:hypothetical protein